jgi:hypothetical protein
VRHDTRLLIAALNRLPAAGTPTDPDPNETLRRLLDEIDPAGADRGTQDFPPRFA